MFKIYLSISFFPLKFNSNNYVFCLILVIKNLRIKATLLSTAEVILL